MVLRQDNLGTWAISCHQLARGLAAKSFRSKCLASEGCVDIDINETRGRYRRPLTGALVKTLLGEHYAVVNEFYSELFCHGSAHVIEWTVDHEGPYSDYFGLVNRLVVSPIEDSMHSRVQFHVSIVFTKSTWLKPAIEALTTSTAIQVGANLTKQIDAYVSEYEAEYRKIRATVASHCRPTGQHQAYLNRISKLFAYIHLDMTAVPDLIPPQEPSSSSTLSAASPLDDTPASRQSSEEPGEFISAQEPPSTGDTSHSTIHTPSSLVTEASAQNLFPPYWPYIVLAILIRLWLLQEAAGSAV